MLCLVFNCIFTENNTLNREILKNTSPLFSTKKDEFIYKSINKFKVAMSNARNPLNFAKVVSANFHEMPSPCLINETVPEKPSVIVPEPVEKTVDAMSGNISIAKTLSVKNQTSYVLDKTSFADEGVPFILQKTEEPQILIIHTHGTESYTPSEKYSFTYTENTRTTDTDYNVVRIGSALSDALKEQGVEVIHDVTMYDYPDYNSSYDKAYYGISAMLKKYPSIQIVLDVHRDAVNTDTGETIKLVGDVNGEKAAQIMFVVGTDECGFSHPNWEYNLKFASILQNKLYNISPSLVRPINLRTSRFNQHFTKGSLIVEVGTNGNTLDEALVSAKYLAQAVKMTVDGMR